MFSLFSLQVHLYRQLVCYMKEHFGDDERGRKKSWYFLPWHFDFFNRYRPTPEAEWAERAKEYPIIQTRFSR